MFIGQLASLPTYPYFDGSTELFNSDIICGKMQVSSLIRYICVITTKIFCISSVAIMQTYGRGNAAEWRRDFELIRVDLFQL